MKLPSHLSRWSRALLYYGAVIGLSTLAVSNIVVAFTEPSLSPPQGTTAAPLNTGGFMQDKSGNLRLLQGLLVSSVTLLATDSGNVGIGNPDPRQKLDITGVTRSRSGLEVNAGDVTADNDFGAYWHGSGNRDYAIFRESGAWVNPYPDLRIAFHTGIKLGAHQNYGGIRFYNNSDMAGLVMAVNDAATAGANNVFFAGQIKVAGGSPGAGKVLTSDASGLASWQVPSGGTITGVTAGSGLIGGGSSGTVTLDIVGGTGISVTANNIAVDTGAIQARVSDSCSPGSSVRQINQNGTVVCESDDVGITAETDTLQSVTSRDAVTNRTIHTAGLALDGSGPEGDVSAIEALIGFNDLFLKGRSDENAPIYYGASSHQFYINGTEQLRIDGSGRVGIGVSSPDYKFDVAGDIRAREAWLRTTGNTGWYSDTYGGGWFMQDTTWIRAYNNKNVYTPGEIQAGTLRGNNNVCIGGDCRAAWPSFVTPNLQQVTDAGSVTNRSLTTGNISLNGAGPEGSVTAVSAVVGFDDLFLRGNSAETAPIYYAGSEHRFYTNGTEKFKIANNGDITWAGTLQSGAVPWARLTAFPPPCSAGQFVSAVGGTLACGTPAGTANTFTNIANGAGAVQFSAAGADTMRFAAGGDLAVSFNPGAKQVTYSFSGDTNPGDDITAITGTGPVEITGSGNSRNIAIAGCASNEILKWSGSRWGCAADQTGTLTEQDPKVGNLTANAIPKWGASTLVNTGIFETSAGNVGIGVSTIISGLKLQVEGAAGIRNDLYVVGNTFGLGKTFTSGGLIIENRSGNPSNPESGRLWLDTSVPVP